MKLLQIKLGFLHNNSPPKPSSLCSWSFAITCAESPSRIFIVNANFMRKPNGLDCSLKFCFKALHKYSHKDKEFMLSSSNYHFTATPNSCATSQLDNTCTVSSSFKLHLGHHGGVRTLLFTRLAHVGSVFLIPIEHIQSCTFYFLSVVPPV